MQTRNWLELARKLVDRWDLDYTVNGMSIALEQQAKDFWGEGILVTTEYPSPFPIALSASVLGGSVGFGVAYNASGKPTMILPSSLGDPDFLNSASDPSLVRWDLLVLRYVHMGDTPVPKPSDPITVINLNLHDDFILAVLPGTPGSLVYPSKVPGDIILAGIQVPAGATLGTQCTLDLSIREFALKDAAKFPVITQEVLTGPVDGYNKVFTLAQMPLNSQSVMVWLNSLGQILSSDYLIVGQTITFTDAPAIGQVPFAWYVVYESTSLNPLSGVQEIPGGPVDGVNTVFTLAGTPVDKASTLVFLDGMVIDPANWNLIQGVVSKIEFLAGDIPEAGQMPYVFYLVNALAGSGGSGSAGINDIANIGTGTGIFAGLVSDLAKLKSLAAGIGVAISEDGETITISAPGASGGLSVYGTPSVPEVIDPSVGVLTNAVQRQMIILRSTSGAQVVTANPQIEPGTSIGQEMILRGTSATNYIVLQDGSGLNINGNINLNANSSLYMVWDSINWCEISRR